MLSKRLPTDGCCRRSDYSSASFVSFVVTATPLVVIPRKEVIQPHLPVRLPCYDFVPVTSPTLGRCLLAVSPRTSGVSHFHDVTGGVYKARVLIHRRMADRRLLATPPSWGRVAAPNLNCDWCSRFAASYLVAAHSPSHCSVCVALVVRAMRT